MTKLSAIVITKNEAHNIRECLESIRWADEIVVVDAESKDATVEIAKQFTDKVFIKQWLGFAQAKQFALQQTSYNWILWLDADERVLPELAKEIQEIILQQTDTAAFTIARRAYFLGKWIKHSGWYPGRVARLFQKKYASFNSAAVHEGLEIHGAVGELKHDLLHFTDPNLFHYFAKFNRYTSLAGKELFERKKKFKRSDVLLRPWWMFMKMYFLKQGFLDGIRGLLLALLSSAYVFTKYAKLWEQEEIHKQQQTAAS